MDFDGYAFFIALYEFYYNTILFVWQIFLLKSGKFVL